MKKTIATICRWVIYTGITVGLLTPLWVNNNFFFPFISSKVFVFRTAVEIMLLAFLILWALDKEFRPRISRLFGLLLLFVAAAFVSSLLNLNFYESFWSNMERGEGLILWLHLAAYLLIVASTVREERVWRNFLDVAVGVGVLLGFFATSQILRLNFLLNTSQSRADAFIGNPAFLAALMIFAIFLASYLLWKRQSLAAKIYYAATLPLFAWTIVATQTRGAMIGLAVGVLSAAFLLAFFHRENRRVRNYSLAAIGVMVVMAVGLVATRNLPVVQNSPYLRVITSISLQERTAQTRLGTWGAAAKGFLQHPIFGVGLENFNMIFDKNFPPVIYQDEGSEVWFDRAHNLVLDRATTTGIVGLLLYLSFLFYPAYYLLRKQKHDPSLRLAAVLVSGFTVAFFIQDLFVFESISTYIMLIFTWSFFAAALMSSDREWRISLPALGSAALAVVYGAALAPLVWYVNLYPAQINMAETTALSSDPQNESFFDIVDRHKKPLEAGTYGTAEYVIKFVEFVDGQLAPVGEVVPAVKPVLSYTDEQLDKQIASRPYDTRSYLLAMRHYNYTYKSLAGEEVTRLEKALSFFPKMVELSPARPQVWQEAGYSHLYLYRYYRQKGDLTQAQEHFAEAEKDFQKTIEINPKVAFSHSNMIMLYLNAGDNAKTQGAIAQMVKDNSNWRRQDRLDRLMSLAKSNNGFAAALTISDLMLELDPNNVQAWISKALSYAYLRDRKNAAATVEKVRSIGGESYAGQVDKFLQNLNSGYYEKNLPTN
jgi:O-antigen ligase